MNSRQIHNEGQIIQVQDSLIDGLILQKGEPFAKVVFFVDIQFLMFTVLVRKIIDKETQKLKQEIEELKSLQA